MPSKTPLTAPLFPCPCCSQKPFIACCQPYLRGLSIPETAEQLMRSRYCAHVVSAIDYLWDTWSAEHRHRSNKQAIRAWAESCEWLGLNIISTHKGQAQDQEGTVEFVAFFRQHGHLQQHHEVSSFIKHLGKWVYVDHQH